MFLSGGGSVLQKQVLSVTSNMICSLSNPSLKVSRSSSHKVCEAIIHSIQSPNYCTKGFNPREMYNKKVKEKDSVTASSCSSELARS